MKPPGRCPTCGRTRSGNDPLSRIVTGRAEPGRAPILEHTWILINLTLDNGRWRASIDIARHLETGYGRPVGTTQGLIRAAAQWGALESRYRRVGGRRLLEVRRKRY